MVRDTTHSTCHVFGLKESCSVDGEKTVELHVLSTKVPCVLIQQGRNNTIQGNVLNKDLEDISFQSRR